MVINMKFYCLDGCKWRCEFDKDSDVFCHAIGRDLIKEEVGILKFVGCATRQVPEKCK
jgi:hypothetical protein